jgi:arginyl-tRNA synthetase
VDIKKEIVSILKNQLKEFTKENIDFLVEEPESENFGDYSSNVTLVASRILKKNPFDLASELAEEIKSQKLEFIEDVKPAKPGFINFYLSKNYFVSQLKEILKQKEKFGSKNEDLNKKVVVEYS